MDKTNEILIMKIIQLNKGEVQSKLDRIGYAENLILQLPKNHEGRNSWLLNYGTREEAHGLRTNREIKFDEVTQSAYLVNQEKDEEELIVMSSKEYFELEEESDILRNLRLQGVDNWGGYSDAIKAFEEERRMNDNRN